MDRLKYRIWDIEEKKYIPNTGNPNIFPFNGKIAMTCNGSATGHIKTDDYLQDCYILEWCIGQKDRKGNLIFENHLVINNRSNEDTIYIVEWTENTYGGNPCYHPVDKDGNSFNTIMEIGVQRNLRLSEMSIQMPT